MDEAQRKERFRVIYEAAYPRILGYALRRTKAPEDAAEVVSETFLTAWRRLEELPPSNEALLWLYGVAHRLLANQRRGEQRRHALSERLAAGLGQVAHAWHDPLPSDLAPFAAAWQRLRPQDRELLAFIAWEGLSNAQLARVLGCSQAVVKLRLHRARRRFAKELAKAGVELDAAVTETRRRVVSAKERNPLKPPAAAGNVPCRRAPARPGTEELS